MLYCAHTDSLFDIQKYEDEATKLYSIFLTCLAKGSIIDILSMDIDKIIKIKVLYDFKNISEQIVLGYKNKNITKIKKAIDDLYTLYNYLILNVYYTEGG